MGKHERQDIEAMERSVVLSLKGKPPIIPRDHKWYSHMVALVKFIREHYSPFDDAEHMGNTYGEGTGDIKLIYKSGPPRTIELKASETAQGKGTLGNISQNAFTEYHLLHSQNSEGITSWEEFRRRKNFSLIVKGLLDSYQAPGKMNFYEKAELVKARATDGDECAIKVKANIIAFANHDKKDYVNYICRFSSHEENIIKFLYCMLNGIRAKAKIKAFMEKHSLDAIRKSTGGLVTLYSNQHDCGVTITETSNPMKEILSEFDHFSFAFPINSKQVVSTHIVGFNRKTDEKTELITLQLNWKNIFQGIKTPCINVFLGAYLKNK